MAQYRRFFRKGEDDDSVNKQITQKHTENITPQILNRNLDVVFVFSRYSLNVIMVIILMQKYEYYSDFIFL